MKRAGIVLGKNTGRVSEMNLAVLVIWTLGLCNADAFGELRKYIFRHGFVVF